MLFNFFPASSAGSASDQEIGPHTGRSEQLVTGLAASLAVLIVAAIAVLLGMA